ncbi:hypothetical protein C9940_00520 [Pseudidiomarina aestuarii]|uniref:Phage abortive infection protein n=1 Tax=Pseudidiomarina aestuarii TaxID=624146 RepID=A0A2T4CZ56_9GAMM|nr:hypothetical protein C9940_00520 [Pseudidiomarina aestuarii]
MLKGKGTFIFTIIVIIVFVLTIVVSIYALDIYYDKFSKNGLGNTEDFAKFGDYIGGILNPVLAFLTVSLLLLSIHLQSKELKASTEELKKTAEAMTESAEFQQKLLVLQTHNTLRQEIAENLELYHVKFKTLLNEKFYLPKTTVHPRRFLSLTDIVDKYHENINASPLGNNPLLIEINKFIESLRENRDLDKYNDHFASLKLTVRYIFTSTLEITDCTYSKTVQAFHYQNAITAFELAQKHFILSETEADNYIESLRKVLKKPVKSTPDIKTASKVQ